MSKGAAVAFYARVSSEAQARDHTIDSQIAALKEHIAVGGFQLEPDHGYVDDGCSGMNLQRLALEKLRDAVAAGHVERIYVHAPDRLARSHAHQVLLIEEFRRTGAEVIFLNRSISDTAEDNLLLQVQGIIAEYERSKILERVRRGRLHAARSGSVSALTGAPFGYRYICRDQGGGVARFEIVEDEADIVRRIFAWAGLDRLSLREVCRRLQQMGCRSRRGLTRWNATTIGGMLTNPAYIGRAVLGRSRVVPAEPRLRSMRRNSRAVPNAMRRVRGPREEWIEVAVPALVDPALFEAVQAQLDENRRRRRESRRGPRWLLQGLTVCRCCGYAYCGKRLPSKHKRQYYYYRCTGADASRFAGAARCGNSPVRGDRLEHLVWDRVRTLLEDPSRVADEYRRRLGQASTGAGPSEQVARLDRQMTALRRGIDRMIDCYAGGFLDKVEFEPRIAGLKLRMSQLQEQKEAAILAANAERELSLVISRLEDFSAKVNQGLDRLDWHGTRQIIHTLVRRIEIDRDSVEVVFRVPPMGGPSGAGPQLPTRSNLQHCTDGYARLRGLCETHRRRLMGFARALPILQHGVTGKMKLWPMYMVATLALAICPAPAAVAQNSAVEKIYADLAVLPVAERSKHLEDGARAEGRLVIIHTMRGNLSTDHVDLFRKRYPFLKIELEGDIGSQDASERLYAEETAGRHLTDVVNVALPDLTALRDKNMLARFSSPAAAAILPPYRGFIDPQGRWTPWYWSEHGISYNSSLVPKDKAPTGWNDLCNPFFKGSVSFDPAEDRYLAGLYAMLGEPGTERLLKCIGENDPIIQRGHAQRIQLMLAGDHMLQGDNYLYQGVSLQRKNPAAPYAIVYSAPAFGFAGVAAINKNAQHPYAAALWADWSLTQESQAYVARLLRGPVALKHPFFPDSMKIVTYVDAPPDVMERLMGYWNKYVAKRH